MSWLEVGAFVHFPFLSFNLLSKPVVPSTWQKCTKSQVVATFPSTAQILWVLQSNKYVRHVYDWFKVLMYSFRPTILQFHQGYFTKSEYNFSLLFGNKDLIQHRNFCILSKCSWLWSMSILLCSVLWQIYFEASQACTSSMSLSRNLGHVYIPAHLDSPSFNLPYSLSGDYKCRWPV